MKRILIATAIGLVALTAGCTGTAGDAKPTSTTGEATPTSGSSSASGLEAVKPCDLLTEAEVTSLGLNSPGKAEQVASSDGCNWTKSGAGGLRTGIRTKTGVADLSLDGEKITDIKVGKYDAKKVEAADRAKHLCTIAISVSESSSVVVIGNIGLTSEDTAAACERSSKAAELIAPKLP
ncbi:Protein of unknown function [Lentzea albidocapillata subsp. violacea]|uniref:DUF3558 domain-containing protein n=1 Tax=Lentzea albidocapillata subsp. violacea TaxID=128104 RepID=A0A1G9KUQ4_9PSEU|nr:DUF3558 family protein [Lentzea albidocapillata]SDL53610.1 Protein of unknown function [Lentzea albidocapillata subsp. violacea]